MCDLFIIYYPDIEYFNNSSPVKLFECLATEKPIISNSSKSVSSILKKNINYLLFNDNFNNLKDVLNFAVKKDVSTRISINNKFLYNNYTASSKSDKIMKIIMSNDS